MERPVFADFSIALLVVMGFNMAFNSLFTAIVSAEGGYIDDSFANIIYLLAVGVIDFILAAAIAMRSALAYKVAIVVTLVVMVNCAVTIDPTSYKDFDQSLQVLLSLIVLILMIVPKSMRDFYKGWSLPRFTKIEV